MKEGKWKEKEQKERKGKGREEYGVKGREVLYCIFNIRVNSSLLLMI